MLKKMFSKKNKNSTYQRDEWIKRDYILVSNDTKPSDLKEYQKLIVLRKPEGEQRCIVDYSLPFDEVDKLHYGSLENVVDLKRDIFNKKLKRIIPAYLNTKEIDDDINNTDWNEIVDSSQSIRESSDLFKAAESEFSYALVKSKNNEVPLLRLDEENGQILMTKLEIENYEKDPFLNLIKKSNEEKSIDGVNKEEIEIDDIDGIDILTDKDIEIRSTWVDVDHYFETKEKVEKRQSYPNIDFTLSPFYVPKIQPLFRNFIDVNFRTDNSSLANDTALYGTYDINDPIFASNDDPVIEKYEDEFVDINESSSSEEPEIVMGDLPIDNSPVEIEQPKVLSFFKNEVTSNTRNRFGQNEHINKHSKFYNSESSNGRNIKYEKIILNKKRGIFNIRKTLARD